ncbi:hypothetical protein [Streptomyces sp. CBMA29]|uniref:hypothetical protein n=1 Tax=Streptomyces sp. CBMA29 TaxID=1896314 RepID=UPI001661A52F|nr:hypothetical protein [Streptomyces sp. CBMA29]MBD0740505.1 hypothetical protein [Streptomyces sp. CBMA29]
MSDMKHPVYGYMLAHDGRTERDIVKDELLLFHWAQEEGYFLAVIYQEVDEGSIAVLTELVEELKRTGDRLVVVPSVEHFGTSPLLQEHLWAYVMYTANVEVREAVNRR